MNNTQPAFCGVPTPSGKTVYAGPATREEFDRLPLTAQQFEWTPCRTTTVIKNDGRQWERRITAKALDDAATGISIIFQWCDYRPAPCVDTSFDPAGCSTAEVAP